MQLEDQSGSDKGLMGFGVPSPIRKPSDGQPFAKNMSMVSSQQGNSSGGPNPMSGGPMPKMMKKMKKV